MEIRSNFKQLFFIKKYRANKNQEAPIYLRITIRGKSVDFSIHRQVKISKWNSVDGEVRGNTNESKELNHFLLTVRYSILESYKFLKTQNEFVTARDIKNSYMGLVVDKRKKIIEIFNKHNEDVKKLEGIDFTSITIKRYETSCNRLQAYIKEKYDMADYYVDEINPDFVRGYEAFIKIEYKISHNTVIKYLKHLKKVLRNARGNGWMNTDPFVNIKLGEKKVDRGFLTDADLKKIISKNFSTKRLSEVRDCFVFACFTGFSYSDLARLTYENIVIGSDGNKWIKINRKKTNEKSSVPILAKTQELINKYAAHSYCVVNNTLLPIKSNQRMNEYLSEIADLVGINQNLTMHLARHTFATTITLNNGVPLETVSKMLGHSSLKTTRVYARLLDNKVGQDMCKIDKIYS